MFLHFFKNTFFIGVIAIVSCISPSSKKSPVHASAEAKTTNPLNKEQKLVIGANQTEAYLPLLKGKKVGIVGNQTSVVFKGNGGYTHLVDSLVSLNIDVVKAFSPEHGFRGKADAGEKVVDGVDEKTGISIVSLYGSNKKPTQKQLEGLDILVFDIQDVGVRFYTYISTLHYVMEAAAEKGLTVLILDRPNPNGHYIDGPILEKEHQSFVGMHPIPIVHGMTIGEYAQMINGEKWLQNNLICDLMVIKMKNYSKKDHYSLPIKPSPNLPNDKSINLYPSLCFFEGTPVNAGRGTSKQFQVFGSPALDSNYFDYKYTPQPNDGAKHPKNQGKICYGKDLSGEPLLSTIELKWLLEAYEKSENKNDFFTPFFSKLAGTKKLQQQIEQGWDSYKIKASWKKGIENYSRMRQPYLLYH
ncbi:uncharacterized protein YbbC (DUF1343 family) [Mesonia algae]|uniref:Uncharacterized protein YbbC (DUF1343 family) n=1 Tax=Mesonia algae TaxID=213248 RepID=A0A2W7I052_9FLAO|nr:DUF1343 domain-containing protein [Mesonia algae]PZW38842.1 uncharacterized protein YbbC (DUF1343 family) [Mesonia algae]